MSVSSHADDHDNGRPPPPIDVERLQLLRVPPSTLSRVPGEDWYLTGEAWLNGSRRDRNLRFAFECFAHAVRTYDHKESALRAGCLLLDFADEGFPSDPVAAREFFDKATGREGGEAEERVGHIYEMGAATLARDANAWVGIDVPCPRTDRELRAWRRKQLLSLSRESRQAALFWFIRAAHLGSLSAILKVAQCYRTGYGTAVNRILADEWTEHARRTHMRRIALSRAKRND